MNIDTMQTAAGEVLSNGSELSNPLRWTGIVANAVKNMDIAVSGGVHDGDAVVKSLLVGASAVELCSVIFEKGPQYINVMKERIASWMDNHNYASIAQFKGKLKNDDADDTDLFERTQFIKYFGGKE